MPLQHLGQLRPTMQQQIALQRALLALAREDEEIRRRTAEKPALARRLGAGPTPMPSIHSMPRMMEPAFKGGMEYAPLTDWSAVRGQALARQLRGAQPTPGYISGEERMGMAREGITAEREGAEAEMSKLAAGLYERLLPLDEEGRRIVMDAVRTHKPDVLDAMEKEGYISPEGVLAEPEEEKKVAFRSTRISDGWEYEDITYETGETESRMLGPAPKEGVEGLTPSEELGRARLRFDVEKAGKAYVAQAVKDAGGIIVDGDMIRRPGENNYRKATAEDVERRWMKIKDLTEYLRVEAEGIKSVEDAKIKYQHDHEAIKNVQRNIPGMIVDGIWTDALGQTLYDMFFKEE